MTRVELTDREFRLFSEWLSESYGLHFGPSRRDILRSRLDARRLALGFDTFEQLYIHLKFHPEREQERRRLLPHLTNNESYFFRESAQLEALVEEVLPEIRLGLQAGQRREIRLMSAGCAAGEEAYTLAMIMLEGGMTRPPWSARITGVDLDPEALTRAANGEYGPNAFRRLEATRRERHFDATGTERWTIRPALRAMVEFAEANLVSDGWWRAITPQDVVFCRNVLIYFDEPSIIRAISALYEMLVPGGYLFLGHAESLSRIPTRFIPVRRPGVIYYRRPLE